MLRFLRDTGGISTQIGDHTHRTVSLDVYAFIELLGQPHGFLGRKIQHLAGFLLQGGGGKRQRLLSDPLPLLHLAHPVIGAVQFSDHPLHIRLAGQVHLLLRRAVILCGQQLPLSRNLKGSVQRPVFLRNECRNLVLSVTDHAQGDRLHASGGKPALYLGPQKRRNAVTHHAVQRSSRLLRVHQVHIDLPGMLQGFLHRILCDFVEGDPVHLFAALP